MKFSDPAQENALIGWVEFYGLLKETLPAEAFTNPDCRLAWECALALHAAGRVVNRPAIDEELARRGAMFSQGGGLFDSSLSMCLSDGPALGCLREIRRLWNRRRAAKIGELLHGGELSEAEAIAELQSVREDGAAESFATMLAARRFDFQNPPPPARTIYQLAGKTICTPGNLSAIIAKPKVGKSGVVGAFLAASTGHDGDTLKIDSYNPNEWAVVHFDTEQSPQDHHMLVLTGLARLKEKMKAPPAWLRSYRVFDLPMKDRLALLEHELQASRRAHGGIHSVLLDGVGDFIADPNDPEQAFGLVERLHGLAGEYQTTIISVLHINPSSETNKTRGHLGSQLERKAETNLVIEKDDEGVCVMYSTVSRHAHVPKSDGPRFRWDDAAGMHVSIETAREQTAREGSERLNQIVGEVFSNGGVKYSAAIAAISKAGGVGKDRAETLFTNIKKAHLIKQDANGFWEVIQ